MSIWTGTYDVAQMLARMIEVPSGVFRLGSCASELGRVDNECPPKDVSIQGPDLASYVAVSVASGRLHERSPHDRRGGGARAGDTGRNGRICALVIKREELLAPSLRHDPPPFWGASIAFFAVFSMVQAVLIGTVITVILFAVAVAQVIAFRGFFGEGFPAARSQ